nr:ATPase 8, plasma membrane-type-like [Tanacetum cinerariifolium]
MDLPDQALGEVDGGLLPVYQDDTTCSHRAATEMYADMVRPITHFGSSSVTPKKFQWLPSVYHVFSFDSIKKISYHEVVTNYVRMAPHGLPSCGLAGNHYAEMASRIEVLSPVTKLTQNGKTECCNVVATDGMDVAQIKLRDGEFSRLSTGFWSRSSLHNTSIKGNVWPFSVSKGCYLCPIKAQQGAIGEKDAGPSGVTKGESERHQGLKCWNKA